MSGDVAFAKEVAIEATKGVGMAVWLELSKRQQSHLQDIAIERVGKRNGYGETVAAIGTYRTAVGMYRRKSGPGADFARMRAENTVAARGQDTFLAIGREITALERQHKAMNQEPVEAAKVPVATKVTLAPKLGNLDWRMDTYRPPIFDSAEPYGDLHILPDGPNGNLLKIEPIKPEPEPEPERSVAQVYRDFVIAHGYAPSDKIVAGLLDVDPTYAAQLRRRMEKDGWQFTKATQEQRIWRATPPPTIEEKRAKAKVAVAGLLDVADEATIKKVLAALKG